jgi:hypothetical protein
VESSERTRSGVTLAFTLVVEANDIDLSGKTSVGASVVHTNSDLLGGIFLMYNVLQPLGGRSTRGIGLLRKLVSYTPRNDRGMIAVAPNESAQIGF